ncbi:MAG: hypothetical protein CO140_01690 [Candidatus Moranbacteria bacterium CG_4_9_14_3_um_filter_40_7]|nr:MAG: hypothetical protein COX31_01560 [Candidatus Moranbacteria bacterium CG23_combo_of_CG06-09_8_20_14_all_40_16]PIU80819.1 MAG: hypothetical protein COS71_01450 [Candidatus Moranbacteria bacterium CG06_land_8_20_14_3_00_40_12]PJA87915.1 MAG: hypothetical protein CO140_01690 [Candidatus Moranbacteria bacterium CG_4_9_14_3_um_filter_40_7]
MPEVLKFLENNWTLILTFVLILGEALWIILLQISLGKIKKDQSLIGGGSRSLEETVIEQAKNLKVLDKDIHELYNISNQINTLAFRSLHKIGIVRFNPFNDIGGDQSFAIALLNGKNNGLVISSLYIKEGTRVFSKAIKAGKAEKHPLTKEEEKAIAIALSKEERSV